MLSAWKILIVTFVPSVWASIGPGWFKFKLLINSGLANASVASSAEACAASCASTAGCSGASYQVSTSACVLSTCGNLHMVSNTGWDTYVLISLPVEERDLPTPDLQWVLTDQCGTENSGLVSAAPDMTLSATSGYAASPSSYLGKAVKMTSVAHSSATATAANFAFLPNLNQGFTFSAMFYATSTQYFYFFEFLCTSPFFENIFVLHTTGVYYVLVLATLRNAAYTIPFTLPQNSWFHFAMVYEASSQPAFKMFINGSIYAYLSLGSNWTTLYTMNALFIGSRYNVYGLDGRVYCIKVHYSALTAAQVGAVSDSCSSGWVRIS